MNTDRLWAKSCPDGAAVEPSMLLLGHLRDVFNAATRIVNATGDAQLQALGLKSEDYRDRLRRCVLLAAAVHDLGKANDHFQGMILRRRDVQHNPQGLRHEWVSLLILQQLGSWLLPALNGCELSRSIVEWAVAGHHPGFNHESPPRRPPSGCGPVLSILLGHPDFQEILDWIAQTFELDRLLQPMQRNVNLAGSTTAFSEIVSWAKRANRTWEKFPMDSVNRRFTAAVKACLIAADVAGSALPRAIPETSDRWSWIPCSFATTPEPGDLKRITEHRLKGARPRAFQSEVANSRSAVTYVRAGCGSGKTVAAYLWAAENHPQRRLYFCYPTTGTATEGFKDYLFEPDGELGNLGARLFHSRRDVDFEIILGTGSDSYDPAADQAARLESLESWSTPIVACTVDNVLGLVQNNKRGLFAWPALAQSAFVFDEIHAYDDRLFGALLRFLRDLPGLPCLLMTASLPRAREQSLFQTVRDVQGKDLVPISGPSDLEDLPRYHKAAATEGNPLPLIKQELDAGGKVLWVCNTVGRVLDAADRAEALNPLIYHSRFRYVDRVERHKRVIDAFTLDYKEPALAICSQVAEMSLDLKGCTLLVTDLAPVPALIQRLGRLNRQAESGQPTRPFVVMELDTGSFGWHLPYRPADMDAARAWLDRLPMNDISQQHLAKLWEQLYAHPADLVTSAWLDGGPTTTVTELREGSPGITVIMNTPDYPDHEELMRYDARMRLGHRKLNAEELKPWPKEREQLAAVTLPMPPPGRHIPWREWTRYKGIPVAPAASLLYDPMRGAQWAE